MKAHKALQTILLIFILTVGSFTSSLLTPPVIAQSSSSQTTLYFVDALNYLEEENFSDFGFLFLSPNTPTKQNDSQYPPNLFIKNTTKLLPRYNLNAEQWFAWFGSTWLLYFLQDSPEFNFSELFPGLDLFFPHPFRIVEGYSYEGNDSVTITGDIIYNLYFSADVKNKKFRDNVKVELYSINLESMLPLPKLISNNTVELIQPRGSDVYKQQVILPDVSFTLKPGDNLLFSIEIVPTNKTISTIVANRLDIDKILSRVDKLASFFENRSRLTKLQDIGTMIKDMLSVLKEGLINITADDFAAIINAMQSTSFVYDSAKHPSSVTVPGKISEEDIRIYYLHADQTMDQKPPTTANQSRQTIKLTPLIWTAPALERNKILKVENTFVDLYLNHRDLFRIFALLRRKITIAVTLYDDNTTISTSEKTLDRMRIFGLLKKPTTPITFEFNGSDREITYGHSIKIAVALRNGTKLGFRSVNLYYDSVNFPSALRMKVEETQNIQITDLTSEPQDGKIIPGESIEYTLNVTSKLADILHINVIEREKIGEWEITVPDTTTVLPNSKTTLKVIVKSTTIEKEAYGNAISFVIEASGNTGIARQGSAAEVSTDAIEYDVQILAHSANINISRGENRTFYFVIRNNNTGAIDDVDSYKITASSRNNWPLIPLENIRNLGIGESSGANQARVVIRVPKNTTLDSDVITITVTSESDSSAKATIAITVHVIAGNLLEGVYELFDNLAKNLGLNEIFGQYGAIVLVSLLMIIILFLLIILALVLTIKPVQIICTDRIKEIEPTQNAVFEVLLKNPGKKTQSYELDAQPTTNSSKWICSIEPTSLAIEGRATKPVQIIVTPTEKTQAKEWSKIKLQVKKTGKKNTASITLLAMIKEGKTVLQIQNVSHWPREFSPGEKVITSFNLSNNGTIAARSITVFFYLNGKQKNKVELSLPAANIADIQIPWIAEKGKNKVRIRVKE